MTLTSSATWRSCAATLPSATNETRWPPYVMNEEHLAVVGGDPPIALVATHGARAPNADQLRSANVEIAHEPIVVPC